MDKPIKKERSAVFHYNEIIDFIEEKYKINVRDFYGLFGNKRQESHFVKYQHLKNDPMPFGNGNYPDMSGAYREGWEEDGYEGWTVVRDGKKVKATKDEYDADFVLIHEHYKRYQNWVKDNPEPEYCDYWHWLIEHAFCDVFNGCTQWWGIVDIMEYKDNPDWVIEITKHVYDEFKDELDKDGGMEVLIEW